jgi:hypothetical protein
VVATDAIGNTRVFMDTSPVVWEAFGAIGGAAKDASLDDYAPPVPASVLAELEAAAKAAARSANDTAPAGGNHQGRCCVPCVVLCVAQGGRRGRRAGWRGLWGLAAGGRRARVAGGVRFGLQDQAGVESSNPFDLEVRRGECLVRQVTGQGADSVATCAGHLSRCA